MGWTKKWWSTHRLTISLIAAPTLFMMSFFHPLPEALLDYILAYMAARTVADEIKAIERKVDALLTTQEKDSLLGEEAPWH